MFRSHTNPLKRAKFNNITTHAYTYTSKHTTDKSNPL